MGISKKLAIFLVILYSLVLPPSSLAAPNAVVSKFGFRTDLTHVDAAWNFTRIQLLKRAAERSKFTRHAAPTPTSATVFPSKGEYLMDLAIGTPSLSFTGIVDSGSDLIWTQCTTCGHCIPQPSPLFDPLSSSTFSTLPCHHQLCQALPEFECAPNCFYHYHYGDDTDTRGFLGTETFTFGAGPSTVRIPRLAFGCGLFNSGDIQNSSGVIGFARGPLSLISQLGIDRFSYCFTPNFIESPKKSPLLFGTLAKLSGSRNIIQTTPLLPNPPSSPFYYLSLKGITVGEKRLPIPPGEFELKKDGSGGTVIDSGTAFLLLTDLVYPQVLNAFKSQVVGLPSVNGSTDTEPFELCFKTATGKEAMPKLILHLEGADWDLARENYMIYDDEQGLICLMVQQNGDMTIIGNVMTWNTHVLYDLKNSKLSFTAAKCDRL